MNDFGRRPGSWYSNYLLYFFFLFNYRAIQKPTFCPGTDLINHYSIQPLKLHVMLNLISNRVHLELAMIVFIRGREQFYFNAKSMHNKENIFIDVRNVVL